MELQDVGDQLPADPITTQVSWCLLEAFVLIGHSLGGSVADVFAESSPERLECLTIEDAFA